MRPELQVQDLGPRVRPELEAVSYGSVYHPFCDSDVASASSLPPASSVAPDHDDQWSTRDLRAHVEPTDILPDYFRPEVAGMVDPNMLHDDLYNGPMRPWLPMDEFEVAGPPPPRLQQPTVDWCPMPPSPRTASVLATREYAHGNQASVVLQPLAQQQPQRQPSPFRQEPSLVQEREVSAAPVISTQPQPLQLVVGAEIAGFVCYHFQRPS